MWKEWFTFSKLERYGIILLLTFVIITAFTPYVHRAFIDSSNPLTNQHVFAKVDSFVLTLSQPKERIEQPFSFIEEEKPPSKQAELFYFDPNSVTTSELVRLGLTQKQAKVVENYRSKGGVFKTSDDFSNIYVIDSAQYNRLAPFIRIDESKFERKKLAQTDSLPIEKKPQLLIEINKADTLQLVKLRGIGRSYARRIVAYRNLLGGYHSTNQLTEVYGFTQKSLEQILPNIYIDTLSIKKININLADYNDLKKHPYLSDYQAKAIVYYRETAGEFRSLNDVVDNKLLDSKTFQRVKYYITVN